MLIKFIVYLVLWGIYTNDSNLSLKAYALSTIFYSASFMCELIDTTYQGSSKLYQILAGILLILGSVILYPVVLYITNKTNSQEFLEFTIVNKVFFKLTAVQHVWFTSLFPLTLFLFAADNKKEEKK